MMEYKDFSLEIKDKYQICYQSSAQKSSDTSFINLWAWQEKYQTQVSFDKDLCWLKFGKENENVYGPPQGDWQKPDWNKALKTQFAKGARFVHIPEKLLNIIKKQYQGDLKVEEDRDNWEYLYHVSDLIALSGERYRNQRKLSNQFIQKGYDIEEINEQNLQEVSFFQQQWLAQTQVKEKADLLQNENKAIDKVLAGWKIFQPQIFGILLKQDGKMVGYSIAEKQDADTLIIHFEKALYKVRGAYPALNRIILQNNAEYKIVNREQDLGLEGLRKAKMEYNPFGFVKKYNFTLL